MGSWRPILGTLLLMSSALVITISSDVRRADDKGDIARRATTLITAVQMRHQLVLPTDLRLRTISSKIAHQALGVWSNVP